MSTTKIEWATKVWNPVTGCTYGCDYCWAAKFAKRLQANPKMKEKYWNGFLPAFHPQELRKEVMNKFKKGDNVFVCSMGDLFDPIISFDDIDRVFQNVGMSEANFLFLTKQTIKLAISTSSYKFYDIATVKRLWFGASITNQEDADSRIPALMEAWVAKRFVSVEPMHGPVDLRKYLKGLDWVICGGESGHKARPMHPDWVRSLRDQCQEAGVAFFFKGWGEWTMNIPKDIKLPVRNWRWVNPKNGEWCLGASKEIDWMNYYDLFGKVGKKRLGAELDGKLWQEFPEELNTETRRARRNTKKLEVC